MKHKVSVFSRVVEVNEYEIGKTGAGGRGLAAPSFLRQYLEELEDTDSWAMISGCVN